MSKISIGTIRTGKLKTYLINLLIGVFLSIIPAIQAYKNPHFYRATHFFGPPRLDRDTLSSIELIIGNGSTHKSRNSLGEKVPLFDLYGKHNMQLLGVGVPGTNNSDPLDLILTNLANVGPRENFATYSISGHFSVTEGTIIINQNIYCGVYLQAYLPISRLKTSHISFTDCSPTDTICPNINTQEWQLFKANLDAILTKHTLNRTAINTTDVGDLGLSIGVTQSITSTTELDFIDIAAQVGVILPTSDKKDENKIFSIPMGYNGHIGIPCSLEVAIGAYEWMTIGGFFEGIAFTRKKHDMRIKTASGQSGMIKLAKVEATVDKGTTFSGGAYFIGDHLCRNLSFKVAYTYTQQTGDTVIPQCNLNCVNTTIICEDEQFQGFKMHVIHFGVDYEQSDTKYHRGGTAGIFYDWNVAGSRIFQTSMFGGELGINLVWDF